MFDSCSKFKPIFYFILCNPLSVQKSNSRAHQSNTVQPNTINSITPLNGLLEKRSKPFCICLNIVDRFNSCEWQAVLNSASRLCKKVRTLMGKSFHSSFCKQNYLPKPRSTLLTNKISQHSGRNFCVTFKCHLNDPILQCNRADFYADYCFLTVIYHLIPDHK